MEYKIRIELLDDFDVVLARTTMTEEHAKTVRIVHGVDVLLDTINIMKEAINHPKTESNEEFLKRLNLDITGMMMTALKKGIDKRKENPALVGLGMWLEKDVAVTKEDVQDYVAYVGCTSEAAYDKLKKYATGETPDLEIAIRDGVTEKLEIKPKNKQD